MGSFPRAERVTSEPRPNVRRSLLFIWIHIGLMFYWTRAWIPINISPSNGKIL
jgi:hypothetical protein